MRARRIFRVLRAQRSLRTIGNRRPERFPRKTTLRSGSVIPNPMTLPSLSAIGTSSGITTGLNCSAR